MNENLVETKKIAIDNLTVEITRKCQLQCAHCMKGDAQNVDMPRQIIDKLLESVCSIGTLLFTGGEPTMNLDGMKYFLSVLKAKEISLNKLDIVTNGCDTSDEVIQLIKEYHDYMTYDKERGKYMIIIGVSNDVYHMRCNNISKSAYENYVKAFSEYSDIRVAEYNYGNIPKAIGRGKKLKEAHTGINENMPQRKIEIMSKESHNLCVSRKYYELQEGVDAVIMCPIIISAHGYISHAGTMELTYEDFDKLGVSIGQGNLIEVINQYNQGAEFCIACMLIERYLKQARRKDELSARILQLLNCDFHEFYKNAKNVSMKEYNELANNGTDYSWSEEDFEKIVNEWSNEVGADSVSNVINTAKEILNIQMQRTRPYRQQAKALGKLVSNLTSGVVQKPSDTAYYGDGLFKNEEERKIHEEHPKWAHKDCVRFANSQKWVEYFSKRNGNTDTFLLMKHLAILQSIQDKYKE